MPYSRWPRHLSRKPFIIGLGGATRPDSSSERATRAALAIAERLGAETELLGGTALYLPMYAPETPFRSQEAFRLVEALRRADGIILCSPGYHGSISGLMKNALDYAEDLRADARPYFDGRAVGCIVCAAGPQAMGTTLGAMRDIVHALRGWPTPLGVAIDTGNGQAFDGSGAPVDPQARERLETMVGQVMDFASMTIRRGGSMDETDKVTR
jgi:FMN reductase